MRLSARSLPRSAHLARHEAKTSFSSRGNMLKQEHGFITHCQDKKKKKNSAAHSNEFSKVKGLEHMENYWTVGCSGWKRLIKQFLEALTIMLILLITLENL